MAINSASPKCIFLGTDDQSTVAVGMEREEIPQHLPLTFTYGRKGTTSRFISNGTAFKLILGDESIDIDDKYYTHATRFAVGAMGQANSIMVQRLIPQDANAESNMTIYADIIADDVPNYKRNSDGSIVINSVTLDKVVDTNTPTIPGYRVKFIKEHKADGKLVVGSNSIKNGTMVDGSGTQSKMYPIVDVSAKYQGEYYNNIGFALAAITGVNAPKEMTLDAKAFPYSITNYTKATSKSSPVVFKSVFGEKTVMVGLKAKTKNPMSKKLIDLDATFPGEWYNETDITRDIKFSDFEDIHVYYDMIETLTDKFTATEAPLITDTVKTWDDGNDASTNSWYDFSSSDDAVITGEDKFNFNVISFKSLSNAPYQTVVLDESTPTLAGTQKEVSLTENTPIFLEGGSDGTMTKDAFDDLVAIELAKYSDIDSEVQDMALNVESVMYDSGFKFSTKEAMAKLIGLRKDTMIVVGTHDAALGKRYLPLSDERSIAVALKTTYFLSPESDYFGTKTIRAFLFPGTGLMVDDSTRERIPMTYEIMMKACAMMGAGNGKWKSQKRFNSGEGAVVKYLKDIRPKFIPAGVKPMLWAAGMNWTHPKDTRRVSVASLQSIYDEDTSVLNSFEPVAAICTLNKIAYAAWLEFNNTSLSNDELIDAIVGFINRETEGRFASMFTITPKVYYTDRDLERGYSWNVDIQLGANNYKTVQTTRITAYRAGTR